MVGASVALAVEVDLRLNQ
ncbi:hypothetical protein L1D38_02060 [Vibrio brasiliensis]|nr:hypothetical protein [Vibrio brasiliensis]MCG9724102.1 hypothetical protein [Vibrio brasiliensis]